MNIPDDIYDYAIANGMTSLATGGGIDYMVLNHQGYLFVLKDTEDAGSPDSLKSPAEICMYAECDEEWDDSECRVFHTARTAINSIATQDFLNEMISTSNPA
ncbi:hypothetical protein MK852_10765 [Shewanella benthica]|nr:hypothetical protein [Shewanella benthica]